MSNYGGVLVETCIETINLQTHHYDDFHVIIISAQYSNKLGVTSSLDSSRVTQKSS